VVENPNLVFDSDAVNMLTEMYHDHGDSALNSTTLAVIFHVQSSYRPAIYWECSSQSCGDLSPDASLEQPFSGYH
jgi:hypothetical protein